MSRYNVLVPQQIAKEGVRLLEENGCDIIELSDNRGKNDMSSIDAVLIRTAPLSKNFIETASNLKVIARHGVGIDNIDIEAASKREIMVCNVPTSNNNAVAEHVVGMIIGLSHQLVNGDKAIRTGDFSARNILIGTEIKGKTLGLIGCGNIGKIVAEKCYSLGLKVEAYDPYIQEVPFNVKLVKDVDYLLQTADYISLHLPYTPDTQSFIDEGKLNIMKPSSFLINAARGGIVDESALYHALQNGKIAGAALDCFEEEPTSLENPLWEVENTIYTPHMAAHTQEAMISMAVEAAKEIIRVKDGEIPLNLVNAKELSKTK